MALEDYKNLFGAQFDDIVDAIMTGGLTPKVEAMIVGTIDEMVFNASVFSEKVQKTVTTMRARGVSKNVINNFYRLHEKNQLIASNLNSII